MTCRSRNWPATTNSCLAYYFIREMRRIPEVSQLDKIQIGILPRKSVDLGGSSIHWEGNQVGRIREAIKWGFWAMSFIKAALALNFPLQRGIDRGRANCIGCGHYLTE